MSDDLFLLLCQRLQAEPDRRGRVHLDCPHCGKEAKRGQIHCSFSERGYYCFVCQTGGSLRRLATLLGAHTGALDRSPTIHRPSPPRRRPPHWQGDADGYLAVIGRAPERASAWQSYKPLSLDTIARFRLGVGVLPSSRCRHRRLIVPVFERGRLVALHGRAFLPTDTDAKWLTAGGSRKDVLYNGDLLRPGCDVVVCENLIDALLAMQETPGVVAVAGGGTAWRDAWSAQIAAARPASVLVWLDHDLAGNGSIDHCDACREAYRQWLWRMQQRLAAGEIRDLPPPPAPRGPQIVASLHQAGVRAVSLYRWPTDAPPKADLGWLLTRGVQHR